MSRTVNPVFERGTPGALRTALGLMVMMVPTLASCDPTPLPDSAPGSAGGASSAESPPVAALHERGFEEFFTVIGRVTLEENDDVLTVLPSLSADPGQGYVVADVRENQVRGYGLNGALNWYFGKEGQGPGEFRRPTAAVRIGERVAVAEFDGRITIWNLRTREVEGVYTIPHRISDLDALDENHLLISTRSLRPGLIKWSLAEGESKASFFEPLIYDEIQGIHESFAWVLSDVREGRIGSTVPLHDTFYVHGVTGHLEQKVPLGIPDIARPVPVPGQRWDEWFDGTQVINPFWYNDSTVVVQFMRASVKERPAEYGLLIASTVSNQRTIVFDSPRLYLLRDGTFAFRDPEVLEGNAIILARMGLGREAR